MECRNAYVFFQFIAGILLFSSDTPTTISADDNMLNAIVQAALLRFHSHTIYDRMLARCLKHVRVTHRGAITHTHMRDILSELPHSEAVILDCTLDFKGLLLPACWQKLNQVPH